MWAGRRLLARQSPADQPPPDPSQMFARIADPTIRAGMEAAILKNMIPVAVETDYPGYFWISADGRAYGNATWPGLDSWQMAGAYLLMGRTRMVLDYFDFVRASQRNDGHIPFAIFPGDTPAGGCLSGLNTPHDIYTYKPPKRDGLPLRANSRGRGSGCSSIGIPRIRWAFWRPVCYVLTAAEIFDAAGSATWLRERLPSLEAAAKYLLGTKGQERADRRGGLLHRIAGAIQLGRRDPMLCDPRLSRTGPAVPRGRRCEHRKLSGPSKPTN